MRNHLEENCIFDENAAIVLALHDGADAKLCSSNFYPQSAILSFIKHGEEHCICWKFPPSFVNRIGIILLRQHIIEGIQSKLLLQRIGVLHVGYFILYHACHV